jgi:glycosidase
MRLLRSQCFTGDSLKPVQTVNTVSGTLICEENGTYPSRWMFNKGVSPSSSYLKEYCHYISTKRNQSFVNLHSSHHAYWRNLANTWHTVHRIIQTRDTPYTEPFKNVTRRTKNLSKTLQIKSQCTVLYYGDENSLLRIFHNRIPGRYVGVRGR